MLEDPHFPNSKLSRKLQQSNQYGIDIEIHKQISRINTPELNSCIRLSDFQQRSLGHSTGKRTLSSHRVEGRLHIHMQKKEVETLYHIERTKWTKNLNIKLQTTKTCRRNVRCKFHDFEVDNDLLVQKTKVKIVKWDYTKLKNFYSFYRVVKNTCKLCT